MFLSSHVLPEVERVCDRVAFIREGELVAVEDVAALTGRAVREFEVVFAGPVPAAAFAAVPGVTGVVAETRGRASLRFTVSGPVDAALKKVAEYQVIDLTSRVPDLEDVFVTFYVDPDGAGGGEAGTADGVAATGTGVATPDAGDRRAD